MPCAGRTPAGNKKNSRPLPCSVAKLSRGVIRIANSCCFVEHLLTTRHCAPHFTYIIILIFMARRTTFHFFLTLISFCHYTKCRPCLVQDVLLGKKVLTESALGKAVALFWKLTPAAAAQVQAPQGRARRPSAPTPLPIPGNCGLVRRAAVMAVVAASLGLCSLKRSAPLRSLFPVAFICQPCVFSAMQTLPLLLIFPQPLWVSPTRNEN